MVIYPRRLDPGFDFKQHLLDNRLWFFALLTISSFVDVGETLLKEASGIRAVPEGYVPYAAAVIGAAVACLFSRSTKVLAAAGVLWLAMDLYFNGTAVGALGDLFRS